ncbi:HEPN domain-containing protein [Aerococcus sanguinicola]|uniref:HEPN domain-containing protein n=1 Tax=Aerococcus TaxID=1375 RepID=UPI00117B7B61|nr:MULTISPECIES: HEPN domain-containing protein [Aerococcus]MDK7049405.1 hypothetical protein [Aerococcus sanguinicola]
MTVLLLILSMPTFAENKLLNLIRYLEVFCRNYREIKDNKPQEYYENQARILEYIQDNVDVEFTKVFSENIKYDDEKNLRKKLNTLFKELPDPIKSEIKQEDKSPSKSISSLAHKLVDTRNYRTHGDDPDKYKSRITDPNEVVEILNLLEQILHYLVMNELGVPKTAIREFQMNRF